MGVADLSRAAQLCSTCTLATCSVSRSARSWAESWQPGWCFEEEAGGVPEVGYRPAKLGLQSRR